MGFSTGDLDDAVDLGGIRSANYTTVCMVDVAPHHGAVEQLLELPSLIADRSEFQQCVTSLMNGETATFDSVWGSSCALLSAALATCFETVLVVVSDAKAQDNLLDDHPLFWQGKSSDSPPV